MCFLLILLLAFLNGQLCLLRGGHFTSWSLYTIHQIQNPLHNEPHFLMPISSNEYSKIFRKYFYCSVLQDLSQCVDDQSLNIQHLKEENAVCDSGTITLLF